MNEISINPSKMIIAVMITTIITSTCILIPYSTITDEDFKSIASTWNVYTLIIGLFVFILGIVVHELIHGIFIAIFSKNGFKDIKFGISTNEVIAPYCDFKGDLNIWEFRICAIMPTIVLALIPIILGFIIHDFIYLLGGCLFLIAGAGDFYLLWITKSLKKDALIKGCSNKDKLYYEELPL